MTIPTNTSLTLILVLALASTISINVSGQFFDRLFDQSRGNSLVNNQSQPPINGPEGGEMGPVFRRMLNNVMSVNVPIFYDMVRNGSSMGINVLQGLVKVERGDEAVRNGLEGRRPLSVRIFGVPVYERGQRVRPPNSGGSSLDTLPKDIDLAPSSPPVAGNEEELPLYP